MPKDKKYIYMFFEKLLVCLNAFPAMFTVLFINFTTSSGGCGVKHMSVSPCSDCSSPHQSE